MIDQVLLHALFTFIASTGIYVPDEKVVVTFENATTIAAAASADGQVLPTALCLNGHVMLSRGVDLTTDLGRSILVHELVHYTQDRCPVAGRSIQAKREGIAYQVQNLYLEKIGSRTRVENPFFMSLFSNNTEVVVKPYMTFPKKSKPDLLPDILPYDPE